MSKNCQSYTFTGQMGHKTRIYKMPKTQNSENKRLMPAYKFNAVMITENMTDSQKVEADFDSNRKLVNFQGEILKWL